MTWSNPTAKIYCTRDSQRKCLCFLISLHHFPYQNICYITEALDHSHSLSITCNHLPQQMASLQLNIKRQEAMFIWNNTQWLELHVHVTAHRNKLLFNKTNKTQEFPKCYFVKKTLHVSSISFPHHQEFSTLHSTLVYFLQVWWQLPSRVRMELSSILTLLGSIYQCWMYSRKLLMMGKGNARNM
jgi:hypothetical protein